MPCFVGAGSASQKMKAVSYLHGSAKCRTKLLEFAGGQSGLLLPRLSQLLEEEGEQTLTVLTRDVMQAAWPFEISVSVAYFGIGGWA